MDLFGSPGRTLGIIVAFMAVVVASSTAAYTAAGWSAADAFYMVLLTVYSVGYGEVHPVDTTFLHVVTVVTMILGCTGVILFTGALVQFLTFNQIQQIFGTKRMTREIDQLTGHVIVVGFGRIGMMLANELNAGAADFVVLEQNEKRVAEARALGYLCVVGDATDEASLQAAGIGDARVLASVLPNDAANVFITLSARSLNPDVTIIARGEMPATESKLFQAGANDVVLPTHIGAERMAEMILYPETARYLHASQEMQKLERSLRGLGLEIEVVAVPDKGALTGLQVSEIEDRAGGRFFIVQLTRRDGETIHRPKGSLTVQAGDGVVIVGRNIQASRALFEAPPDKVRAGRQVF